jgi:murein DD-endopeptidase MepM/ murein hydrolase activator NlpD
LTLHPAATTEMPIATRAKTFTAPTVDLVKRSETTPALRRSAIAIFLLTAGCSAGAAVSTSTTPATAPEITSTQVVTPSTTTTTPATTTTTAPRPLLYVFPFTGKKVSYGHTHHDYPAADVFGCGANVVAPIGGTIDQTRTIDPWAPKINDPATRGGKYVSMLGDDGVRYYFAHLDSVAVQPGDVVDAGAALGVMGQTGNARNSACHTHFGISWPCDTDEWAVRRGEIWPWRYLDAWRTGQQLSPVDEVAKAHAANPDGCTLAGLATSAGDA